MDLSSPSTIISNENENTPTQVNKCKQPGMVDSLGMFLPSKNMVIPTSPPNFISSKPMKVFGKTFPKYDRFPLNTMNCQLDANDLYMTLCAYAFPPAGFKSQADVKEGIPVNGTAPRLIFYNDKNAFNLNMDSKYIKRLVQFGLLFLRGNPHLPQDEQDMSDIFSENPELEYPWKEMWELFENSEKRKIRSPPPNPDSGSADRGLHGNESEDEGDVSDEEEEEEEEERQKGEIDITDFEDLKTYKNIPGFRNFPTWLQEMIKEFKTVFTNQLSKHSIMNVKPATFTLKKNVEIPNNNLTAHFPPANLRDSADKLLDKLEQGGLIKKAPRVTSYKSKAFFKAKKNNEARLLVDYKASQVNELLERPTHPQFSVEQVIQQVKPGNEYFLSADITGAFFCHPLQEGPEGGDVTTFLSHRGKYFFTVLPQGLKVSQDFLSSTLL